MEQLISLTNEKGAQMVDARELHTFLEIGKFFSNWIKDRIDEYGFEEGKDFLPKLAKSTGGRQKKEYLLTLDTAKELAMVERSEKGKQARRYFIEVEKQFKKWYHDPMSAIKQRREQLFQRKEELEYELDQVTRELRYYSLHPYVCPYCNYIAKHQQGLASHLRVHKKKEVANG